MTKFDHILPMDLLGYNKFLFITSIVIDKLVEL